MKNNKQIRAVAEEAAQILKDYPHLKYSEAIQRAKEVIKDETRGSNRTTRLYKKSL